MPKYSFTCPQCGEQKQTHVPPRVVSVDCPKCSSNMTRELPILNGPSNVTEVIDKNTGITWTDGQPDMVKDRKEKYYWSVEVPRFVLSGTYSVKTMLENDWIRVDDAGKIHVNDKPPHER